MCNGRQVNQFRSVINFIVMSSYACTETEHLILMRLKRKNCPCKKARVNREKSRASRPHHLLSTVTIRPVRLMVSIKDYIGQTVELHMQNNILIAGLW